MKQKISLFRCELSIFGMIALFLSMPLRAQVTVGDQTPPQTFSVLELTTSKLKGGLRLPQLTTKQRDLLTLTVNPDEAQGLLIFNTDIGCVEFWNLNEWISICSDNANIFLTDAGDVPVDPSATRFPQTGTTTDILVPHNTPECVAPPSPPYTESIKYGGSYAHIAAAAPAGTGAFTMTTDENTGCGERYIILSVKDSCLNQEQYFLFVQEGTIALPDAPTGVITGAASVCPTGITQKYSVTPVAGATSYIWKLPEGWTGSSNTASITATPGLPTGTKLAENTAAKGNITVSAVNGCGTTQALSLQVTTCSGCCAYVSSTDYVEFMCRNLGANPYADPLTPSADIHGAKYKWSVATPVLSAADDQNPAYDAGFGAAWTTAAYGGNPQTGSSIADWDMTTANPCPLGYRVPTMTEWNNVVDYNAASETGSGENDGNYTSGIYYGNSLFLPYTGVRTYAEGKVQQRGVLGLYWTDTNNINNSINYAWSFNAKFGDLSNYAMNSGQSIRCIKQ